MTATMIAAFCVAAVADPGSGGAGAIEGRWVAEKRGLVLDVSRCGAAWCGVAVTDGRSCGATVLRLAMVPPSKEYGDGGLVGRIELAAEGKSYAVQAGFMEPREGEPPRLLMLGNRSARFEPMSRNYPFREMFARAGDAACTSAAKVS
jgi:hypothetical protein